MLELVSNSALFINTFLAVGIWIAIFFAAVCICIGNKSYVAAPIWGGIVAVAGFTLIPSVRDLFEFSVRGVINFVLGYIIIGLVVTFINWILNVRKIKSRFVTALANAEAEYPTLLKSFKERYESDESTIYANNPAFVMAFNRHKAAAFVVPSHLSYTGSRTNLSEFRNEDIEKVVEDLNKKTNNWIPPRYTDYKLDIAYDATFWWVVIVDWLSFGFVRRFINLLLDGFAGVFNMASRAVFGNKV